MLKKICILFTAIIFISSTFCLQISALAAGDTVGVGGMAFGIKFQTDGVLICGISEVDCETNNVSPGKIAKLKKGDIILKLNGKETTCVDDIIEIVNASNGCELTMDILRADDKMQIKITPVLSKSEGTYKLGLWIKDGTAGIGTVTYIDVDNKSFAGLGHGVCDIETGQLMKLRKGSICDVTINGIKAGVIGNPGELQGFFSREDTGLLLSNTEQGVFGVFNSTLPDCKEYAVLASREEVNEGDANILCTLDDNSISRYDIKIEKINNNSKNTKNFIIRVTDETLLKKTGGIVQGMSGSPIIQNGKLVGAVTHVLVDDPTRGYGIFIENMLQN